jgi:glutamate/tyrosine decarboxylase-like PLP-dependent enzyme
MEEDESQGLIPFFVSTTLGTTGACGFDALEEIGQALQKFPNVWLHVDAAYAGNAFICPELKYILKVCKGKFSSKWRPRLRHQNRVSFFVGNRVRRLVQYKSK